MNRILNNYRTDTYFNNFKPNHLFLNTEEKFTDLTKIKFSNFSNVFFNKTAKNLIKVNREREDRKLKEKQKGKQFDSTNIALKEISSNCLIRKENLIILKEKNYSMG